MRWALDGTGLETAGADWWVAGPAVTAADEARVELDEVARLYTENGLWEKLG